MCGTLPPPHTLALRKHRLTSRACSVQVADDALAAALSPPAHLIVSTALTSVGGGHLDESTINKDCKDLEAAQAAFRRALEWWPAT